MITDFPDSIPLNDRISLHISSLLTVRNIFVWVQDIIVPAQLLKVPLLFARPGGPQTLESYEDIVAAGPYTRRYTRYSVAGRELIDTLDAVRRYDFVVRELSSYRLKDVARHFGLASPQRVYLEGAKVFETYRHDPEHVRRYALDDVEEVDGLSRRLMGAAFALAGMAPRRYERIASAGPAMGILEPMLVRAYLLAGAALPHTPPDVFANSEPHAGGAAVHRRLLPASDVASQVRLSKTPQAYLAGRAKHPEPQYEALLAAGRTQWNVGERVRFYRAQGGVYTWLPEETDGAPLAADDLEDGDEPETAVSFDDTASVADRRDYHVDHYLRVLLTSYASRLKVAFAPDDFDQLFRLDGQTSLFDQPLAEMQLRWIRCDQP